MPERICLFGGTFDPIHNAHLGIAREAAEAFHLTRVIFVPAGNPPHKDASQVTPYQHRFRMVELACDADPLFVVSKLEEGAGRSYTINTVRRFRKTISNDDRLFFLIGSDAFDEIESWKNWQDLVQMLEFIVVARPGHHYRTPSGARVHRLDDLALPISSSSIRQRLADGQPTPELPVPVRQYIDEHHLYGARL